MKLTIYGCRGTIGFARSSNYGGNSACMALEAEGSMIILDAGSGILGLDAELRAKYPGYPDNLPFTPSILISHLHLDHIIGLTEFAPIWTEGGGARIFTCTRDDRHISAQIFGAFMPPYWPAPMAELSFAECVAVSDPFEVDNKFTVMPFYANHPDKTLSFHITDGHKTLVYLLDHEMLRLDESAELLAHCRNADMVVFDAAYLLKDYPKKRGWGHSTVQDGVKLAEECGCKRMMFAHYAQAYEDSDLDQLKEAVPDDGRFLFARDGMVVEI